MFGTVAKYPSMAGKESILIFAGNAGFCQLTVFLAVSLKCFCFDQDLARTMFPYFVEVAKTTVLRCSSGIADDGKQSAALLLLGP